MSLKQAIGCMIGGAYGDSLGAAVEFIKLTEIHKIYGPSGITVCSSAFGHHAGLITDDTQMAIATARGVLCIAPKNMEQSNSVINSIWHSYLVWLKTQKRKSQRRAPGSTCLSALSSGKMGSISNPLNYSSGCGAIIRAHPIGIAFSTNPKLAFQMGMESGAITHGHPDGYAPAGTLAMIIAWLLCGKSFEDAVISACKELYRLPEQAGLGTLEAIEQAFIAPVGDSYSIIDSHVGTIGKHPGGWLGHDALAIALYAIRCAQSDPLRAVQIAVNHSGDSDSTGSIAGAIMGTIFGPEVFYTDLKRTGVKLEHAKTLKSLATNLWKTSEKMNKDGSSDDIPLWINRMFTCWKRDFSLKF